MRSGISLLFVTLVPPSEEVVNPLSEAEEEDPQSEGRIGQKKYLPSLNPPTTWFGLFGSTAIVVSDWEK